MTNDAQLRLVFQMAFIRALERWTLDLRAMNDNRRYWVAWGRNEYAFKCGLTGLEWGKS